MPSAETLALSIPIIALLIPVVAILTQHQRKMAELMHMNSQKQLPNPEIDAMRRELNELKTLVHQQAIQMDNYFGRQPANGADISNRLGSNGA